MAIIPCGRRLSQRIVLILLRFVDDAGFRLPLNRLVDEGQSPGKAS